MNDLQTFYSTTIVAIWQAAFPPRPESVHAWIDRYRHDLCNIRPINWLGRGLQLLKYKLEMFDNSCERFLCEWQKDNRQFHYFNESKFRFRYLIDKLLGTRFIIYSTSATNWENCVCLQRLCSHIKQFESHKIEFKFGLCKHVLIYFEGLFRLTFTNFVSYIDKMQARIT